MIIGITGNLSSGKTTLLSKSGYKVILADQMVSIFHDRYKEDVYEIMGTNDKKEIMDIILTNSDKKTELELFFKELIEIKLTEFKYTYRDEIILFEAANIFETGLDELVSHTIYIDTPKFKSVKNALKLKKYPLKTILLILKNQLNRDEYLEKSDYSFKTSSNIEKDIVRFKKFINLLTRNK